MRVFLIAVVAAFVALSFVFPFLRYEFGMSGRQMIGGLLVFLVIALAAYDSWRRNNVGSSY